MTVHELAKTYLDEAINAADHARELASIARASLLNGYAAAALTEAKEAERVAEDAMYRARWAREKLQALATEQRETDAAEQG